jgi:V8-like Glu-specific endopeptidase
VKDTSVTNTSSFPYNTIVYITDTIGGVSWQGSGVLIAPNEVLTASHLVYNSALGAATNIVVTPGYQSGSKPYGSATGDYFHYNTIQDANDNISFDQSQDDYAVIHLSQPFSTIGVMGIAPGFNGGVATVSGYPAAASGQQISDVETFVQNPNYSLLDGTSLGAGSSGGPVWITNMQGDPLVVGLVSSGDGGSGSAGFFTEITQTAYAQIMRWVYQDEQAPDTATPTATPTPTPAPTPTQTGTPAALAVLDTTTGQPLATVAQHYGGPVSGIQQQYVNVTTDSLNITPSTPNWFIHTGSGNDAIAVSSGRNVLDGGTGSNFLTGGSGTDTFFIDDRNPASSIWSTVANFHAGDAVTIWGVSPSAFAFNWVDGQGASGYLGLSLHVTDPNTPTASLTLTGYSMADLTNGRLSVSYGTDTASGSAYMSVTAAT